MHLYSGVLLVVLATLGNLCLVKGVSRQKRDDANPVVVTTILEAPYLMEKDSRDATGNDQYEGLIKDMMEEISEKLMMDYRFKPVEDGRYGGRQEDGTWTGMMGEIINTRADIAAAPITVNQNRDAVVQFTVPFETFSTVMLMKKGKHGGITKIADLAGQDEISYGVVRDGSTGNFFKTTTDPVLKTMWEPMQAHLVDTLDEGVTKVRDEDGKFVFILENATAQYHADKEPCDLDIVGDSVNEKSFAFALPLGSDYLEPINNVINDMKSSGKLRELRLRYKSGSCGQNVDDNKNGAPRALTGAMTTVSSALAVTALAMMVSNSARL